MRVLNKKWKELLFAFSGFGPNLLMVLMGAYFTDALNPAALPVGSNQAIGTACYIMPVLFPILYAVGKIFDGIIDVPFAHITDTLSTRWGRRRPAILVCMLPMIISFALCWMPIFGAEESNQLANTIWISFWAIVFFATYTMCLIAYYGSLSSTCSDEPQRLRVSGYKSFFDTISYCLVYALVPLLLDAFNIHIDKFVFICLPLMLTIAIPLFMIKEGEKYGYPENDGLKPEKISIIESIKLTFGNKIFLAWLIVNSCTFFGLQMFLVGMNAMINGGMGFNGGEMAIINTCAFGPVPIMLYLFNKLKAKKGVRFTYQTCLLAFAVAILSFFFASLFVTGGNKTVQYVISIAGGIIGSWAIGAFFMMPYLAPAQVSAVEEKLTGKNHSAMYFAANALVTSVVGAVSGTLVYDNIKRLFITKGGHAPVIADNFTEASLLFGVPEEQVFNLGTLLVPFIVATVCVVGFFLAFKLPKDFTPEIIAKEFKKMDPTLDISSVVTEDEVKAREEKSEILFVQIGLSILSGFIFGFIWTAFLFKSIKEIIGKKSGLAWALCCFIPFAGIFIAVKRANQLKHYAESTGIAVKNQTALHVIFGIIFPILPVNVVSLALMQTTVNKIYNAQAEEALPVGECECVND